MSSLRILLLADTHLGFDAPRRPRIERRRRGPDFFASYRRALAPTLQRDVDLVVHGGDLLFRSRVPAALVAEALEPLREVTELGVPVVLVPGNHERSQLPYPLLGLFEGLHVIDRPRTVTLRCATTTVAVSGFPFVRRNVRERFPALLDESGFGRDRADVRLLCLHQTVEGARVGPDGYTFRHGDDVVAAADLPGACAAVLAGHIHRHQVLECDLAGDPLPAPVLYPGSTERTSLAERRETKGFVTLVIEPGADGGRLRRWAFHPLPTRPMVAVELFVDRLSGAEALRVLRRRLGALDREAVVQLRIRGQPLPDGGRVLTAARIREVAPATMTLSVSWPDRRGQVEAPRRARRHAT